MMVRAVTLLVAIVGASALSIHTGSLDGSKTVSVLGVPPTTNEKVPSQEEIIRSEIESPDAIFGAINLVMHGLKHEHGPYVSKETPEEKAWNAKIFWICVTVVLSILALCFISVAIWACTCGRSQVFAGPCIERLKNELQEAMSAEAKGEAKSAPFRTRYEAIYAQHDTDRKGSVAWSDELKEALDTEYGREIREHDLYKEFNEQNSYNEKISQQDFYDAQKYYLFMKHDMAMKKVEEDQAIRENEKANAERDAHDEA